MAYCLLMYMYVLFNMKSETLLKITLTLVQKMSRKCMIQCTTPQCPTPPHAGEMERPTEILFPVQ